MRPALSERSRAGRRPRPPVPMGRWSPQRTGPPRGPVIIALNDDLESLSRSASIFTTDALALPVLDAQPRTLVVPFPNPPSPSAPAEHPAAMVAQKKRVPHTRARNPLNAWATSLKAGKTTMYPADDVPQPLKTAPKAQKPAKIRASLAPGRVCILLAGRFKGRRAVVVKHLPSGLLLVTGPYSVNGVPLKRVNPAYAIGTSTQVDVAAAAAAAAKVDDAAFARPKRAATRKGAEKLFGAPAKKAVDPAFKALNASIDAAVAGPIEKDETLKSYFRTRFSLSTGDKPHLMKF